MPHSTIDMIVIAKPPEVGEAKTRLALDIGDTAAIGVYRGLLENTLRTVQEVQVNARFVYTYGDTSFKAQLVEAGFQLIEDLGSYSLADKVLHAFSRSFVQSQHAIMIVADDFFMTAYRLAQSIPPVLKHEVVLGPTIDGGLYLIGLSCDQIDIVTSLPFGRSDLCSCLLRRAIGKGYPVHALPKHIDIDSEEHLEKALALSS